MSDDLLETNLCELFESETLKWIFVGGKGGVGKTTSSCSIAVELSKRKEKVLIISTDPAHNLSDAFTQKFTNKPTLVNGFQNLYAMEIDSTVQENTAFNLQDNSGFLSALPELLNSFPGIDEALSFAELMNSVQSMEYSTIVFDTAPTGHTLRLLSFPSVLEKGLAKFREMFSKMSGAVNMLSSLSSDNNIDNADLMSKLDSLKAVTSSIRQCFQDPTKTTFVCVCIPEFLSVFETERLVQELTKQNIDCSNIIVNQVLFPVFDETNEPDTASLYDKAKFPSVQSEAEKKNFDALVKRLQDYENNFLARRKMQMKYLGYIRDLYAYDFHVTCVPLQRNEVRGINGLEHFAKLLQTTQELPVDEKILFDE